MLAGKAVAGEIERAKAEVDEAIAEQEFFGGDRFLISESDDNAIDLCLMTFCNSHIIANSSFSWWGAWLAGSKEVIAPKTWFGPNNAHKSIEDLIPKRWNLI